MSSYTVEMVLWLRVLYVAIQQKQFYRMLHVAANYNRQQQTATNRNNKALQQIAINGLYTAHEISQIIITVDSLYYTSTQLCDLAGVNQIART